MHPHRRTHTDHAPVRTSPTTRAVENSQLAIESAQAYAGSLSHVVDRDRALGRFPVGVVLGAVDCPGHHLC